MPIEIPSVGRRYYLRSVQLLRNLRSCRARVFTRVPKLLAVFFILASIIGAGLFGVLPKSTSTANAATTSNLNFQGRLLNASGGLVDDGFYNIQFNLYYQASGGTSLWNETYLVSSTQGVRIKNGYFNTYLGSLTSFPSTIDWDQEIWLGMTIRGTGSCSFGACTPTDAEMSPRFKLTAVSYAFKSAESANVKSAATSTASTNSSNITVQSGNAIGATSNSGNISIDSGTATGTTGQLLFGTTNASAITLGHSGITTTLQGSVSLTGAGTALTVTNNVQVDGNTTLGNNAAADSLTVNAAANFTGNLSVSSGNTFTNAGSTVFTAITAGPFGADGSVGSAASTVDVATTINLSASTTGVDLTLASPTSATAGRILYINNTGANSLTVEGNPIASGKSASFIWNGTAWVQTISFTSTGVDTIGAVDTTPTSANGARISGTTLYLQYADATYPGLVSTTSQTFAGAKTFTSQLKVDGSSDQNQLIVEANATQTVPLVLFQNSSGTELARINVSASSLYFGNAAGGSTASGANNTGIGASALGSVSTGTGNTTLGSGALASVSVGTNNTALGYNAGNLSTGSSNLFLGQGAGSNATTGSNNIIIGAGLNASAAGVSNELRIGGVLQGDTSTLAAQFNGTLAVATLGTADTSTFLCRNTSNQLASCSSTPLTSSLTDNITDALDLQESTNNYININTTNGSENVSFGNASTNPSYNFLGSGTLAVAGSQTIGGTLAVTGNSTLGGDLAVNGGDITTAAGDLTIAPAGNDTLITGNLDVSGTLFVGTGDAFQVSSAGAVTAVGVNSGTGLIQGTGGLTILGTTSINATGSSNTSIGATSNSGTIAIGNSASTTNILGATTINTTGTAATSIGNSGAITTLSGSSILLNSATLQRTSAGTTSFDLVDGANTTLALQNSGAGVLNLTVDGSATVGTNLTVSGGTATLGTAAQAGSLVVSDGSSSTITIKSATQVAATNYDVTVPAITANDTFCLFTLNNCVNANAFVQNGNSFTAAATLGTNDAYTLAFETNNITRITLDTSYKAYFGNGATNATPQGFTLQGTSGSGTNITGAGLTIASGQGTGTGTSGNITFQYAPAGASGSSLNALQTACTISGTNGSLSCPGAGSSSERFGAGATAGGSQSVALGYIAQAGGVNSIAIGGQSIANVYQSNAIGWGATSPGTNSLAVGTNATSNTDSSVALGVTATSGQNGVSLGYGSVSGFNSTALGQQASANNYASIALGSRATTTADYQLVVGSENDGAYVLNGYLGAGITSANAASRDFKLQVTSGSGTNIGGADFTLASGQGTGTGTSGNITFQYAPAGASGSSLNALQTACTISGTNGSLSCPGAGSSSERFGAGATAGGSQSVALGNGASAGGNISTAIGYLAVANTYGSTVLGYGANAPGTNSVALGVNATGNTDAAVAVGFGAISGQNGSSLGYQALSGFAATALGTNTSANNFGSIAIGSDAATTAANQLVVGGNSTAYISDAYFGSGVTSANAASRDFVLHATGGSGTNIGGADFTLAAGQGTGTGVGGSILFRTAAPGASGSSLNALTTRAEIQADGDLAVDTNTLFVDATNNRVGIVTATPSYDLSFGSGASRTIRVENQATLNTAGNNLTVQAGTGNGTGGVGGVLTLQGGSGSTTNINGGNVVIAGGASGGGSGVKGLVVIDTATYSTATVQNFTANANITQANIDSFGAVSISGNVAGWVATLTDPTLGASAAGRVIYVSNTGSVDITLAANTVGVALSITLKPASTATMYWNGTDWTAAGASSSTDLQAAYNNTATSAGGAELVLNAAGGAADGLTVRNNATTPIIGGLLEVQTAIGSNLFTVNNNATEYATNGGAETAGGSSSTFPSNTWDATTGGTVDRWTTTGDNVATGQASVRVQTTTTNHGARNRLSTTLTSGLTYTVSFAVRGATNFSTLQILYSPDGTTTGTTQCATAQTVTTGQWTRITCSFIASGTITSSNSILIRQTDGVAHTFYIDNLSVNVNASANHAADGSVDNSGAFATNWTNYQPSGTATTSYESNTIYDTAGSAQVDTSATAGIGLRNNMAITPQVNTQYLVSFYAYSTTTMTSSLAVGFLPAGGTGAPSGSAACTDYSTQSLTANTWTKITCLFTTPGSGISNPDLVVYQTDASARTIYVDALSITLNTNNSNNVQIGGGNKGGPATLFTLDRSAGAPIAANNDAYLGSMYYDTTTGRIQCYEADGWGACGAAPDNIVNLNPEYAGAVLNGSGVGTMTADFCSDDTALTVNASLCETGQAKNYYRWTSPQATSQTYSIYVTYQLPATFADFSSDDTVQLTARVDNTSNAEVTYQMFRSTGSAVTQCGTSETDVIAGGGDTANVWHTYGINGNEATGSGGCAFAANDFIIFKINMKANSNANAYVSTLSFVTTGR